jgi:hypothetical protein
MKINEDDTTECEKCGNVFHFWQSSNHAPECGKIAIDDSVAMLAINAYSIEKCASCDLVPVEDGIFYHVALVDASGLLVAPTDNFYNFRRLPICSDCASEKFQHGSLVHNRQGF